MSGIKNSKDEEINKIIESFYISKGYNKVENKWINPKTGFKVKSVVSKTDKQYSKTFKKFWTSQFKSGETTIYYDDSVVLNPSTGRFIKKKGKIAKKKIKDEDTEIFQNKIIKTDDYLQDHIYPQVQSAIETGDKTTIDIETGKFGNIKKLLEFLPFGDKKMYFINEDGTFYFLNPENIKRIADIQEKFTTGINIVQLTEGARNSDMDYVIDTIYHNI